MLLLPIIHTTSNFAPRKRCQHPQTTTELKVHQASTAEVRLSSRGFKPHPGGNGWSNCEGGKKEKGKRLLPLTSQAPGHVPFQLPFTGKLKSPPLHSLSPQPGSYSEWGTPLREQQHHQLLYHQSKFLIRVCKTGLAKALLLHVYIASSQSNSLPL